MTRSAKITCWTVALALLGSFVLLYLACRNHSDYYQRKKGRLSSAELSPYRSDPFFTRYRLSLQSDSGLTVKGALLAPATGRPGRRRPAVVLLAGLETGMRAVEYIREIPDAVIAAIDYPYEQHKLESAGEIVSQLPALRRAALDTVPSAMLLVDYLKGRPDVDPSKVVLIGLSLGAAFVPCVAVEDRRPSLAVMVFGGGDLREMIRQKLRRLPPASGAEALSYLGDLLLCPLEPLRYAAGISPVPLLMINGTEDELIPRRCSEEFFRKAREPKKIIWLEARHMTPGNAELTGQIVEILKRELKERKILF